MHYKTGKFARGNEIIKLGISNLRTNIIRAKFEQRKCNSKTKVKY